MDGCFVGGTMVLLSLLALEMTEKAVLSTRWQQKLVVMLYIDTDTTNTCYRHVIVVTFDLVVFTFRSRASTRRDASC